MAGPLFGFSDTWQLVINTGTTIVTFLMVFLIQRSQNKDSHAVHLKLNELVAAVDGREQPADQRRGPLGGRVEGASRVYGSSRVWPEGTRMTKSHSVEEAESAHARKLRREKKLKS